MTYQEVLSMLHQSEKYGVSVPDTDYMTEEEVIRYAEEMYRYADALEAEATGN